MPLCLCPTEMSFGEVEAALAEVHHIASSKRTAFQARLKNFLRIGIPTYAASGRGRRGQYGAFELATMALAVELSQLGLAPAHATRLLDFHWPTVCAAFLRATGNSPYDTRGKRRELIYEGDFVRSFLLFDPAALWPLMEEARMEGADDIAAAFELLELADVEDLHRLTSGSQFRGALINVSALVTRLSLLFPEENNFRWGFFEELRSAASDRLQTFWDRQNETNARESTDGIDQKA